MSVLGETAPDQYDIFLIPRSVTLRVSVLTETAPDQYDIFFLIPRSVTQNVFEMVSGDSERCRLGLSIFFKKDLVKSLSNY